MPVGQDTAGLLVTADEMRARLPGLAPADQPTGAGPARSYRLPGAAGTVSFITPVSEHFCASCNRLRLTADGKIRPCLLTDGEVDIRTALRNGATIDDIASLIVRAAANKPERHQLACGCLPHERTMTQIGG